MSMAKFKVWFLARTIMENGIATCMDATEQQ